MSGFGRIGQTIDALPCVDGHHDFGGWDRVVSEDVRDAWDDVVASGCLAFHCCRRCGWSLERLIVGHPLLGVAHYFRVAMRALQGAPP